MSIGIYDVAVVGAGPSGSIAAYEAARKSLSVLLLEKEELPRYKACGGVLAPHVEKILDFSIAPAIERSITKVRVTVKLQSPFVTESPHPFAYMVMRDTFDNYLVQAAARAGVDVRQQTALEKLTPISNEGYFLHTTNGDFRAKYIIGADGANSAVRKLVGAPPFQRLSVAIEREIESTPELLSEWNDTIALDFGVLTSGYAWVFPKAKNFSIGAGGPKSTARQLEPYYEAVRKHYSGQIGHRDPFLKAGHYLPIRVPYEKIEFDQVLLVGDAAGLVDPLAGEGIYYAIRSGQIAADCVHAAVGGGDRSLDNYQRRIEEEIQPELQVSKSLLFLLDLAPQFWVPRFLKPSHPFWRYFYRIFTGEKEYQDLPRKFGPLGSLLFSLTRDARLITRDTMKPYN